MIHNYRSEKHGVDHHSFNINGRVYRLKVFTNSNLDGYVVLYLIGEPANPDVLQIRKQLCSCYNVTEDWFTYYKE